MSKAPSGEDRAPFTREQIVFETRRAALAMASMLAAFGPSGSLDLAATFLGVELDGHNYDDVDDHALARIPIERLFLYRVIMDAYDYAYQVGSRGLDFNVMERAYEVAALLTGFPQTDFNGEASPLDRLNPQKLRQVLDTFSARYALDIGSDLSVRDLALLAQMGEAAVRSSLSAEKIKAHAGKKGEPYRVAHDVALNWLHGRRGFVPTVQLGASHSGSDTIAELFSVANVDLSWALAKAMEALDLDLAALAEQAEVETAWLQLLVDPASAAEIDLPGLERVAGVIGADGPVFVGRAVTELLVRRGGRNASFAEGDR